MFISENSFFKPISKHQYLSSPTMHREELEYIRKAYKTNRISTVGANINEVEKQMAEIIGYKYAVTLSVGTATLRLAMKVAGVEQGDKIFCSDMTFDATVNPVVCKDGIPMFIDTEYDTWNMDPVALEKAFEIYPDVEIVVVAHLYGTPGRIDEIKAVYDKHSVVIVEDAAGSLDATYKGRQTGNFGKVGIYSFNRSKIITGSAGGMFPTDSKEETEKTRKWNMQGREGTPWYQHGKLGYNYRMSNAITGVVRGQVPYLNEYIAQKKAIYERYRAGFKGLSVRMDPIEYENSKPNYWLSCLIIDPDAICKQVGGEGEALCIPKRGKSYPTEILDTLTTHNAEGRPAWKSMHIQPTYRMNGFATGEGNGRTKTDSYIAGDIIGRDGMPLDVGADIFHRGLCLPSDNKTKLEQQDAVTEIIRAYFE